MVRQQFRFANVALSFALVASMFPTAALAQDRSEGFGVNSFRYRDGEPCVEELVEEPSDEPDEVAQPDDSYEADQPATSADDLVEDRAPLFRLMASFTPWTKNSAGKYVSSNGQVVQGALRRGVDVSEWNDTIDWAKAKSDDVSFAILRCGGTYMSSRTQYSDDEFDRNAKECERLGIPYGVYFFSTAKSASDAKKELNFTLNALKGRHPTLPIYYDLEWDDLASTRNRALLAEMSTVFCEGVKNAGYEPGVYASVSWWENYLTDSCFDRWTRWVAQYYSKCEYSGKYDIWQCTSVGTIKGIPGSQNVDLNLDFRSDWGKPAYTEGWEQVNGRWRWRYATGAVASSMFKKVSGKTYYFDASGWMVTGWYRVAGKWYLFDGNGAMQYGWTTWNGNRYLLSRVDGVMCTGWDMYNGTWYLFDSTGRMLTGWQLSGGKWYYLNPASAKLGAMVTGWHQWNGSWYWHDSKGIMATGWRLLNGKWYLLNSSGAMLKGWQTWKGLRYYLSSSGAMVTGWQQIGGKWYWFYPAGHLLKSGTTPDGYSVGADGAWTGR